MLHVPPSKHQHLSASFVWRYCSLLEVILFYTTAITHVSQQLLVLSGDVELNPGPKHGGEFSDIIVTYACVHSR